MNRERLGNQAKVAGWLTKGRKLQGWTSAKSAVSSAGRESGTKDVIRTGTGAARNGRTALSIDELMRRYEICNRAEGKSEKTIKWYDDILRSYSTHLNVQLNRCDISGFTMDTVRDYIVYLRNKPRFQQHPYTPKQDKPVSARTVQCHVRGLKAFSSWAHREGYTVENRLQNLKLPKAPFKMMEPLTPEEIKLVSSSTNKGSSSGLRNYAILVTLLDTGLRESESVDLTLSQTNLEDGYCKVMGKGAKERMVPIGKFVRTTLLRYIDQARPSPVGCDNLFLSRTGKPMTANSIKLLFSRLAKTSGVKRLHAHLCRHTFAINYLLNGGDIFSLQEILGHTSLDMVRHYLHFTSSQIRIQHNKYSPMDKLQAA